MPGYEFQKHPYNVNFEEDQEVIAKKEKVMSHMLRKLKEEYKKRGNVINLKKN